MYNKRVVIAIGGNSLTPSGNENWITSQFHNTRTSIKSILPLITEGYEMVITHGNGPQVGIELKRVEETENTLPEIPLGILVAETQGSIGYMIEQSLQNTLKDSNINAEVSTVLTQVLVDKNDPALLDPSKFVGSFYSKEEAEEFAKTKGWVVKKDADRGYRRVVGSPTPLDIINKNTIKQLLESKNIVIAAGGGGIPVYLDEKNRLEGVDAVIDKDMASSKLANNIGADELYILTAVDKVCLKFGTPEQKELDTITIEEAKRYYEQGEFPKGSMGPKIKSAIEFIENGGKRVIITAIDKLVDSINGKNGTSIIK